MTKSLMERNSGFVVSVGDPQIRKISSHLLSSSTTNRLLPYCYIHRFASNRNQVLPALDIGDAFLAVDLQQPKILTGELASDDVEEFALGKVLPGQRDGSLLWYQALASFLPFCLNI